MKTNKIEYSDCVLDLYKRIEVITANELDLIINDPKYYGQYEICYDTFIENFEEVMENDDCLLYKCYYRIIREITNRESKVVSELIKILTSKFDASENTCYTLLLDLLDAQIFQEC